MKKVYILLFVLVLTSLHIKAEYSSTEDQFDFGNENVLPNENVPSDSDDVVLVNQNVPFNSAEIVIDDKMDEFYDNEDFSMSLSEEIEFRTNLILAEASSDLTSDVLKDIFPNKCDIVIDKIASTVRSKVTDVLLEGSKDIKKACPKWNTLSHIEKKNFYVALVTSMALAESSCNNNINNRSAPNGTAFGLWQSTRRLSVVGGASWAMNQIGSQVEKSGLLFWGNSNLNYWAVLNPNIHAYKVKGLLKKIPACAAQAIKKSAEKKKSKNKSKK